MYLEKNTPVIVMVKRVDLLGLPVSCSIGPVVQLHLQAYWAFRGESLRESFEIERLRCYFLAEALISSFII